MSFKQGRSSRVPRSRAKGRLFLGQHLSTLVVLLLVGTILAGQGFGRYITPVKAAPTTGGGIHILIPGSYAPDTDPSFALSISPITGIPPTQLRPSQDEPAEILDDEPPTLAFNNVMTQTVRLGDDIYAIAEQFGVEAYTIFWVNELHAADAITPGMMLTIPPLSGVPHTVQAGETLYSIADVYGVRPGNIVGYPPNGLKYPYELLPDQQVFVPGGIVEIPSDPVKDGERPRPTLVQMPGGEKMAWPTWGSITAPFGWSRFYVGYHQGLDIANSWGTPIYAAAAGEVIEAGWGRLGWWVAIDHGHGFRSEYGHMAERPLVTEGEQVERGQLVGNMGSTYGRGGYSSGVHLHFAVRHLGDFIDPLPLLEN